MQFYVASSRIPAGLFCTTMLSNPHATDNCALVTGTSPILRAITGIRSWNRCWKCYCLALRRRVDLRFFRHILTFRVYKGGDVLKRHRDRPSCEVSVTLNLGYEAAAPWPIWLEVAGAARSFALQPGDALLYQGTVLRHWRESFVGAHSVQVFLHYVDRNGPCNSWKYDGRPALATTPVTLRIMEQFRASLSLGTTGISSPESSHTLASS